MRTQGRTSVTALAALCAVAFLRAPAGAAIPIHFAPGGVHGQGHGFLRNIHDQNIFVFSAHARQHVRVNIVGHGATRGVVSFPGGGQDGSPGGVVYNDRVPRTGLYHLRVTEDSMAQQWRGPVTVFVTRH